jgi:hypothetical protein
MDAFDSHASFTRVKFIIFRADSRESGAAHAEEIFALNSKQPRPSSVSQSLSPLIVSQPRYGAAMQSSNEARKLVAAR